MKTFSTQSPQRTERSFWRRLGALGYLAALGIILIIIGICMLWKWLGWWSIPVLLIVTGLIILLCSSQSFKWKLGAVKWKLDWKWLKWPLIIAGFIIAFIFVPKLWKHWFGYHDPFPEYETLHYGVQPIMKGGQWYKYKVSYKHQSGKDRDYYFTKKYNDGHLIQLSPPVYLGPDGKSTIDYWYKIRIPEDENEVMISAIPLNR